MTNYNQSANPLASSSQQQYDTKRVVGVSGAGGAGGATAYSTQNLNHPNNQPLIPSMPQGPQMVGGQQYQQAVQAYSSHPTNFQSPGLINSNNLFAQDNTLNTSKPYTNQSINYTSDQFTDNPNFNQSVIQPNTQTAHQVTSALPISRVYTPKNPSQLDTKIINPVNNSHQKGKFSKLIIFSLIGLMTVLCIVCIGVAGFVYFSMQQVKGLKTLESGRYAFFYPDKYVPGETVEGELLFINPEKNQMGGNNSIRTLDPESLKGSDRVKDEKTCREFYESSNNIGFGNIRLNIDSVNYYEFAKTRECSSDLSLNTKSLGVGGKVFIKARLLIKDGAQGGVVASYDDKISEEEKDQLNRSVKLFDFN